MKAKNENSQIVKVERKGNITLAHRKDGVIDFMVPGGADCTHMFAALGQGYDGKYYYRCIVGHGCYYKKKLTKEKVEEYKRDGLLD